MNHHLSTEKTTRLHKRCYNLLLFKACTSIYKGSQIKKAQILKKIWAFKFCTEGGNRTPTLERTGF